MAAVRAVLFDFGGTLYNYATLEPAERESLVELARRAGIDAEPDAVQRAHRDPPTLEPRPRHVIRRIPDLLGLLE